MKNIFAKIGLLFLALVSVYACDKEDLIVSHEISIYGDIESYCTSSLIQECSDSSYNYTFFDISVDSVYQDSLWGVVFKYDLLKDDNTVGLPVVEIIFGLDGYGLVNPEIKEIYELIESH